MNWISAFEPQNVNSKDLVLPNELKKMSGYTKQIITELEDKTKYKITKKRNNSQANTMTSDFYQDFKSSHLDNPALMSHRDYFGPSAGAELGEYMRGETYVPVAVGSSSTLNYVESHKYSPFKKLNMDSVPKLRK